jgi:ferredoxin
LARMLLSTGEGTERGTSMATRSIVKIDEERCTGCGLCVPSCAEGALQIVDGKARLVKEIYCDGLGACLGECPEDAITIEEREAEAFDPQSVDEHLARQRQDEAKRQAQLPCGCPGATMRTLDAGRTTAVARAPVAAAATCVAPASRLGHWPVQIHLVPIQGAIWDNADVLIAADCVPFAMADFHERLLAGRTVAVGCPKLDDIAAHTDKLTGVFASNSIRSVTVAHMEVPCCTAIVAAVQRALEQAGRSDIEIHDVTVAVDGTVLSET